MIRRELPKTRTHKMPFKALINSIFPLLSPARAALLFCLLISGEDRVSASLSRNKERTHRSSALINEVFETPQLAVKEAQWSFFFFFLFSSQLRGAGTSQPKPHVFDIILIIHTRMSPTFLLLGSHGPSIKHMADSRRLVT